MTLSVIIVTLNRAECLRQCLERLRIQDPAPAEVIVVDASTDGMTELLMGDFPEVDYVRTDVGYGHMTASRNLGLLRASGDIIAFIDDDAFAHPGWSHEIVLPFSDPAVGGVGGRALNRQPGEETEGASAIGLLTKNGRLTGNFAADPGRIIETVHIIGCNMAWRRTTLAELGGLREDYPGTEVREETDVALRVRSLEYRILFNPAAVVDHIGASQAKGRRFDVRYAYYAQRNHVTLLLRNFGPGTLIFWRYLITSIIDALFDFARRIAAATARMAVFGAGTFSGVIAGALLVARSGTKPERTNAEGKRLRAALSRSRSAAHVSSEVVS